MMNKSLLGDTIQKRVALGAFGATVHVRELYMIRNGIINGSQH